MISGTYATKWFDGFVVFGDIFFYFFRFTLNAKGQKVAKGMFFFSLNHVFLRASFRLFLLFTFQLEFVLHLSLELLGADGDRGMDKNVKSFLVKLSRSDLFENCFCVDNPLEKWFGKKQTSENWFTILLSIVSVSIFFELKKDIFNFSIFFSLISAN